jgi:glycosyltransferase involved in cell wall biosynthesis
MLPERANIALVIVTGDAGTTIARCITSARTLVKSVLVVDSFSTDDTVDVARREGAVVLQRPFINYSDQRNWASEQIGVNTDWILHLDSDEYLTPELATEISSRVSAASDDTDGFLMRRRVVFLGREMRHGGLNATWHLRMYRPHRGWCEDRRYDQHFIAAGRVERLRACFVDDNRASLERWTDRHNRWSTAEAEEVFNPSPGSRRVKPALLGSPINRKRWLKDRFWSRLPTLWRPFAYFAYRYFFCLGFLDGREGLVFHVLQGFWFRFLVDSKLYEQKHATWQVTHQPKDVR